MATPEERLQTLGIALPAPPAPAAAYVPVVQADRLLFVAGQVPVRDGALVAVGKVGAEVDIDAARECARQCGVNVLAQARAALGTLERVAQVVKLTVYVASAPSFTSQHLVADGASQLFADVFGERGRHARAAVGAPALPLDAPVEVEAVLTVG